MMNNRWVCLWFCGFALFFFACGARPSASTTPSDEVQREVAVQTGSITAAIAGAHRSAENRARDRYRHPEETLTFFGLEPTMNVIEMAPGRGWYTEVLAPVLRDHGRLTVAMGDPAESDYARDLVAHLERFPSVFDQVERVVFSPPEHTNLGSDGSADMVLTFRSTHGWINRGQAEAVFAAMFRVLRPGGILGVVQHRADDHADPIESAQSGYVSEPHVRSLAEAAGFVLEDASAINRNEADDHDHPEGVWTLPPTLRLGDENRAEWERIGESDRMTLRFRKPDTQQEDTTNASEALAE